MRKNIKYRKVTKEQIMEARYLHFEEGLDLAEVINLLGLNLTIGGLRYDLDEELQNYCLGYQKEHPEVYSHSGNGKVLELFDYRFKHRVRAATQEDQRKFAKQKLIGDIKASKDRGYGHTVLFTQEDAYNIFGKNVEICGHHLDDTHVIYIPVDIHISCLRGKYKEKHRQMVADVMRSRFYLQYYIIRKIVREKLNANK